MKRKFILFCFAIFLFGWTTAFSNDEITPTLTCNAFVEKVADANGCATFEISDISAGAFCPAWDTVYLLMGIMDLNNPTLYDQCYYPSITICNSATQAIRMIPFENDPSPLFTNDCNGTPGLFLTSDMGVFSSCWGQVQVQGAASCPPDLTISCAQYGNEIEEPLEQGDLSVLDQFGTVSFPTANSVEQTISITPLSCTGGALTRHWTAFDVAGNVLDECSQELTIEYSTAWDLVFPADVTVSSYHTDTLYGEPEPTMDACVAGGIVVHAYEDIVIVVNDSTLKVLRTWTCINWCTSEVIESVQLIKVFSAAPPLPAACYDDQAITCDFYTEELEVSLNSLDSFPHAANTFLNQFFGTPNFDSVGITDPVIGNVAINLDACNNGTITRFWHYADNVTPTTDGILVLADQILGNAGDEVCVRVYVQQFEDILSLQFSMNFPSSLMEFTGAQDFGFPGMTANNFGTTQTADGVLTFSWFDQDLTGVTFDTEQTAFLLCFTLLSDITTPTGITFSNQPTAIEVTNSDGNLVNFNGFGGGTPTGLGDEICRQTINVNHVSDWIVSFPPDSVYSCTTPGSVNFGEPEIFAETCELIAVSYADQVFTSGNNPDICYKIERLYTVINWCVVGDFVDQEIAEVPENQLSAPWNDLDGDGDSDGRTYRDSWNSIHSPSAADAGVDGIPDTDLDDDPWDGYITHLQIIEVEDSAPPLFVNSCTGLTACLEGNGFTCIGSVIIPEPEIENCSSIATLTAVSDLGDGFGPFVDVEPGIYNITFTAEDICGNTSSCASTFEVVDCMLPVAVCDAIVALPLSLTLSASMLDDGSYDACLGDLLFSLSPDTTDVDTTFTCDQLGSNFVEMWVTDAAGNQNVCFTELIVEDHLGVCPLPLDTIAPVAICNSFTFVSLGFGPPPSATLTGDIFDSGSYDDMPGDLLFSFSSNVADDTVILTCDDLGTNFLELWVTDAAGNQNFCSLEILLEDKLEICGIANDSIPPVAICDEMAIVALAVGMPASATVFAETFDDGSYDNVSSDLYFSFSTDINDVAVTYTCADLGNNLVEMWVTDAAGNQNVCLVEVLVQDNLGLCVPPCDSIEILSCPEADAITCDFYASELESTLTGLNGNVYAQNEFLNQFFGEPEIINNCADIEVGHGVIIDLNQCGEGTITRNWMAVEAGSNGGNPNNGVFFNASPLNGAPGDVVCTEVSVENFDNILSFQFSMNFDEAYLQFENVQNMNLPGFTASNFGALQADIGNLTVVWFDPDVNGEDVVDGTVLYEVCFTVLDDLGNGATVEFSENPTAIEVVDGDENLIAFNGSGGGNGGGGDPVSGPILCSQTITVQHVSNWVVEFPEDVAVICTNDPLNTGEPEIFFADCELTAVSYEDFVFTGSSDTYCYKIERKWSVINWCAVGNSIGNEIEEIPESQLPNPWGDLDGDGDSDDRTFRDSWDGINFPDASNAGSDAWDGYIEYTQVIEVTDEEAPIFTNNCQLPEVCITSNDCNGIITIPTPEIDDCSDVDILAVSDLGIGFGPFTDVALGTYNVSFEATDRCDNVTLCQTTVTVVDCILPTPYCLTGLVYFIPDFTSDPTVTIWATDFNAGSFDNCTDSGDLLFSFSPDVTNTNLNFDCDDLGANLIQLWVTDEAGNQDFCEIFFILEDPANVCPSDPNDCDNDQIAPSPNCWNGLVVQLTNTNPPTVELWATDFDAGSYDNCPGDLLFSFSDDVDDFQLILTCDDLGMNPLDMWVTDAAGNQNFCQTFVIVQDNLANCNSNEPCDNDAVPPLAFCANGLVVEMNSTGALTLNADNFDVGSLDNCTASEDLILSIEVVDNSGQTIIAPAPSITFDANFIGANNIVLWVEDEAGNQSSCNTLLLIQANPPKVIHGKIFSDLDMNCTFDNGEPGLDKWVVKLEAIDDPLATEPGIVLLPVTYDIDADGNYTLTLPNDFTFYTPDSSIVSVNNLNQFLRVSLATSFNYGQNCPYSYFIDAGTNVQDSVEINFPVQIIQDCPQLSVDISTPFLRRCFDNNYYVHYCNFGNVDELGAYIEIELDANLTINSSSRPYTQNGNLFTFDIGEVPAAECNSFQFNVTVSCDAVLGETHCVEAHIYPDDFCLSIPPDWSGARVEVDAICDGDSLRFFISNNGTAPMDGDLQYIVIEDVIMYNSGSFNLLDGESKTFAMPANGSTWRLEAEQESGHPGNNKPSVSIEGCSTTGTFSTGIVNQFSQNDDDPFVSIFCMENVGSFDPNDKLALPVGYGEEHFIEPNTELEYMIRFQNTGTDTAFNIVLMDTLSQFLNPLSVRAGASSHPYDFTILGGNVLKFNFDNIMLPDSNVNEPASHGYIQFRVSQQADVPLGTVIENHAAIYFDFNDPIITNTTFHTINEHFIEIIDGTQEVFVPGVEVKVYPNPAVEMAIFEIVNFPVKEGRFTLYDMQGRLVEAAVFTGNRFEMQRGYLPTGMYFYKLEGNGTLIGSGKLILK